uniref:Paragonial peptide PS-1 n=1 Tax=Drosophila funebris TaxID=7221 RepID=PPS1_DROFU|nr:RecName: Full=Paragonial peptide PS-1; AltName: Full=Paragonial peptide C [Drosophila funebris]
DVPSANANANNQRTAAAKPQANAEASS